MLLCYGVFMKIQRVSFYNQFHCAINNCPDTCCSGWRIPIDPQTLALYRTQKGSYGLKLKLSISRKDNIPSLNRTLVGCPFHDKDGLCSLQKEHGEAHMPAICRRYPRNHKNYGEFAVETLELSCPETAKIFLKNQKNYSFLTVEEDIDYPRSGTNQDYAFLHFLMDSKAQLLAFLKNSDYALEYLFPQILDYGKCIQNQMIIKGGEHPYGDFQAKDYTDCVKLLKYSHNSSSSPSSNLEDIASDIAITCKAINITGSLMDALMTSGIYHTRLKRTAPFLYELCQLYFDSFDLLTEEAATKELQILWNHVIRDIPTLPETMKRYYGYYLDCCYYEIFETYSFAKTLTKGFLHVQMLQLFFSLYYKKYHSLTLEEQARIIAAYEKRGRHNTEIVDAMYAVIYSYCK